MHTHTHGAMHTVGQPFEMEMYVNLGHAVSDVQLWWGLALPLCPIYKTHSWGEQLELAWLWPIVTLPMGDGGGGLVEWRQMSLPASFINWGTSSFKGELGLKINAHTTLPLQETFISNKALKACSERLTHPLKTSAKMLCMQPRVTVHNRDHEATSHSTQCSTHAGEPAHQKESELHVCMIRRRDIRSTGTHLY